MTTQESTPDALEDQAAPEEQETEVAPPSISALREQIKARLNREPVDTGGSIQALREKAKERLTKFGRVS